MKTARLLSTLVPALPIAASAAIVINEVQYDDTGTADDREFVELINNGSTAVDISGWVLAGRDVTTQNPSNTIPGAVGSNTTVLAPGAFYVFGNTGTLNVNQVVTAGFLENDNEVVELYNDAIGVGTLVDAFSYETNKGATWASPAGMASAAEVLGETGPGYFGNHQGVDLAGTPLNATVSLGRFVDGRDTNNNGRDFGLRPATPGTTNAPGGLMTSFSLPDPAPLVLGSSPSVTAGSFVNARVIDPTIADGNNPNVIAAPNGAGSKAYVAWDPAGGGNSVTSTAVFDTAQSGFSIRAYLETADLPVQSNAAGTQFRGTEVTLFGIGSGDALTNLVDISGSVGLSGATPPAAETANGFTGYAWLYERVGMAPGGGTAVSEFLYLVNANDGGDAQIGGNTPLDWTVIFAMDLASTPSGWFELSISIDGSGNGLASFDGALIPFSATDFHSGAFNVGYRENLQLGADGTPDAIMRPATFAFVPEPSTSLLLLAALLPVLSRRRTCCGSW